MGTPDSTVAATMPTKKMIRLSLPSGCSSGCANQNSSDHGGGAGQRDAGLFEGAGAQEAQHGDDDHERHADRDGRGAPGVVDLHRRGDDEAFFIRVFGGRVDHQHQESDGRGDREGVEQRAGVRLDLVDQRRHAHVLTAAQRDDRAQHGQPQEHDGGQLVRPDQRRMEDVARDHAGEEHEDFGQHQDGGDGLHHTAQAAVRRVREAAQRVGGWGVGRWVR
jgi:hypothetical protein